MLYFTWHCPQCIPLSKLLYKTSRFNPIYSNNPNHLNIKKERKPSQMAKEGLGLDITELRLGFCPPSSQKNEKKRAFSEIIEDQNSSNEDRKPPNKTQIVGWPPVCSYRKNNVQEKKFYIKVSMDGAPFLRKIDLSTHYGYSDLVTVFEKLFGYFGIGELVMESENSEYIPIYEDKDGDWMLLGDVPWEMFTDSCKRLRIMKRSDVKGVGLQSRDSEENRNISL
ncbi:hypothetical protein GIB67_030476 [Kingdonia uniflora]|uniref:Auxin-responsive protein n=1 Tax=Kingdonia uniflora TaxID=39325 RepID=A0A7J7P7T1_9MAGN|nr:hypothetical protein GIB67_030476 [Kingdonia uniflora]